MTKKLDAKELDALEVKGVGKVAPGMLVEHPFFGVGKVDAIFEFAESGQNSIRIDFSEHGSKALAPEFANLRLPSEPVNKKGLLSKILDRFRNA